MNPANMTLFQFIAAGVTGVVIGNIVNIQITERKINAPMFTQIP